MMTMQLLRDDLIILPPQKGGKMYLVRDPRSREVFEFGESEYFLLDAIRKPYAEAELLARFNARFGFESTIEDLQEFLVILNEWGLLQESLDTSASERTPVVRLTRRPLRPSPTASHPRTAPDTVSRSSLDTGDRGSAEPPQKPSPSLNNKVSTNLPDNSSNEDAPDGTESELSPPEVRSSINREIPRHNHWSLFCPERFFDLLILWLYPMHFLLNVLPLLWIISIIGLLFNLQWVEAYFPKELAQFDLIARVLAVMFTTSLVAQGVKGITARFYRANVPSFGITLVFGLFPRFHVPIVNFQELPRKARLRIALNPILARLTLFSLGTILWLMTRSSGTLLPMMGYLLADISMLSLLLDTTPFMQGTDGYLLLTALLEIPNLRQKANRAFFSYFSKRPSAFLYRNTENAFALRVYALACLTYMIGLFGLYGVFSAWHLESSYQGAGVVLFLVITVYVLLYFRRQISLGKANLRAKREAAREAAREAKESGGTGRLRTTVNSKPEEGFRQRPRVSKKPDSSQSTWLRYLLIALFIGCLFLPYYPYETGGTAQVLSVTRSEIHAETAGVVEKVFFEGGEWVEKGTVIARMDNHTQIKDVLTTQAALQEQRSNIAKLLTTPTKEEVDLAVQQLELARVQSNYSIDREKRMKKLYESGYVSLDSYDSVKKSMEVDKQEVLEKDANVLAVKNKVNTNQIEAARAEEKRLQEELKYYQEQLRRTSLRAPTDGRIITMDLKNFQNKYLKAGDLFAQIEDARHVRVQISIPESDASEASLNARVRLKVWDYPNQFFYGTISEIYPATSTTSSGTVVVQVESVIPNQNDLLKSGMTGYAKVEGSKMFVIEAFTRALVRFVLIEVWSWIP